MKKKKQSLLWQIQSKQIAAPSYLFGTMHIKDQRAFKYNDILYDKIQSCNAFATEFNLDDMPHSNAPNAFLLPKGNSIEQLLGFKKFQKLQRILKRAFNLDLRLFNNFQPFLICNMIGEAILSQDNQHALDAHLWHYAKKLDKQLTGIETYEEQIAILKKIPIIYQVKALLAIGKNVKKHRQQLTKITEIYQEGNPQKIYKNAQKGAGKLRKLLLYNRNQIMAERIAQMARQNTFVFAIGAGHLGGQKGVLRLLKKQNFSLHPIPPST